MTDRKKARLKRDRKIRAAAAAAWRRLAFAEEPAFTYEDSNVCMSWDPSDGRDEDVTAYASIGHDGHITVTWTPAAR